MFKKLPPLETQSKGCLNCGVLHQEAPMDMLIAVGFGEASVTCDGETVYFESQVKNEKFWTVATAEYKAIQEPKKDWRIIKDTPMYSCEYQRQEKEKWVLIKRGQGFA